MVDVEKVQETKAPSAFDVIANEIAINVIRKLSKGCNANSLKIKRCELWDVRTH